MINACVKAFGLFVLVTVSCFAIGSSSAVAEEHAVDRTHSAASPEMNSLLEFKSSKTFFTVVVFVILAVSLYVSAWKPIAKGLEQREELIAKQIADAKSASETAAAKLKEYESKLADAAVQAQETVVLARKDAEAVAARIKADAQVDATRLIERAKSEIETAKQAAISELASKSTDLAFGLARKVIGRELKPGDHQQLISDAVSRIHSAN